MAPKVFNKLSGKDIAAHVLESINRQGMTVKFDTDSPFAKFVLSDFTSRGINVTFEDLLQALHEIFEFKYPVTVDVVGSLITGPDKGSLLLQLWLNSLSHQLLRYKLTGKGFSD